MAGSPRALLEDCMRVLFYRDCRALNRIQIAKATVEGTVVSDPYTVRTMYTLTYLWEVWRTECLGGETSVPQCESCDLGHMVE